MFKGGNRSLSRFFAVLIIFFVVSSVFSPFLSPRAEAGGLPGPLKSIIKTYGGSIASGVAACGATFGSAFLGNLILSAFNVPSTDTFQVAGTLQENCLKEFFTAMQKRLLAEMIQKTVNWANTGFKGDPFYVRDLGSYYQSIGEGQTRDYINELKNSNNPYAGALAGIIAEQSLRSKAGVANFNLDQLVPNLTEYEEDFSKGGWDAWLAQTIIPENNPLGSQIVAADNLGARVSGAVGNAGGELAQNNGFLSMKKCVEEKEENPGVDPDNSYISTYFGLLGDDDNCAKYETVTPGQVISEQLTSKMKTGEEAFASDSGIVQVINKIFQNLFTDLANKGLASLSDNGSSGPSSGGTSEYGGYGSNSLGDLNLTQTGGGWLGTAGSNVPFDIFSETVPLIALQQEMLLKLEDLVLKTRILIPWIRQADYCIPGPRPNWHDRAAEKLFAIKDTVPEEFDKDDRDDNQGAYEAALEGLTGMEILDDSTDDKRETIIAAMDRVLDGSLNLSDSSSMPGYKYFVEERYKLYWATSGAASRTFELYDDIFSHETRVVNALEQIGRQKSFITKLSYIENNKPSPGDPNYDQIKAELEELGSSIKPFLATGDSVKQVEDEIYDVELDTSEIVSPTNGLIAQCELELAIDPSIPNARLAYGGGLLPTQAFPGGIALKSYANNNTFLGAYSGGGTSLLAIPIGYSTTQLIINVGDIIGVDSNAPNPWALEAKLEIY